MGVEKRDKIYLDVLRIAAIFLVVINHTGAFHFPAWNETSSVAYFLQLFWNEIVKMAVPLFFMVSGALLLPKEESLVDLYKKRMLRFCLVYILIVGIQYNVYVVVDGRVELSLFSLLALLYGGGAGVEFHAIWFLHAYLGIMLLLPVYRVLARGLQRVHYAYVIGIQLVLCGLIPVFVLFCQGRYFEPCFLNHWLPFQANSPTLPFSYGYCIFYMFLGYYAEYFCSERPAFLKRWAWAAVLLLLSGCLCMAFALNTESAPKVAQSVIFLTAFLPVPCVAAYLITKSFCARVSLGCRWRKIIGTLGMASFTVMLTENLFRVYLRPLVLESLNPLLDRWGANVVLAVIVTVSALLLGVILKQIPVVKKLI